MSTAINWSVSPGDPVLQHPLYQKWSNRTFGNLDESAIKADIQGALADNASAAVVSYLCWLTRVLALVA